MLLLKVGRYDPGVVLLKELLRTVTTSIHFLSLAAARSHSDELSPPPRDARLGVHFVLRLTISVPPPPLLDFNLIHSRSEGALTSYSQ